MKKITQFVFYGKKVRNSLKKPCIPEDLEIWKTNLLTDCGPVSHLGIQGEPGVIFYLNYSNEPISIGSTGIYEINLEGLGYISALTFDTKVLGEKYDDQESHLHRLLVDVIHEGVNE
jgi:hypothetical protein